MATFNPDQFRDHLLSHGGQRVVGLDDPDVEMVAAHGSLEDSDTPVVHVKGAPSQCHSNVARLCSHDDWVEPRTGYALSGDGIWRPHSWGYDAGEGHLIETTESREKYFGATPDRNTFIESNY